jgi:Periplasmic copper-binding protein (NosD)
MEIPENCRRRTVPGWCVIGSAGGRRVKRLFEVSPTLIAVVCAGMFFNTSANAATQNLCVDPSNTPHCSATIQDAVDQAKTDAVITVVAGTFDENIAINTGASPKKLSIVIQGAGVGGTIVDGGALDSVFNIGPKTTVTLSKMTIQNGEHSVTDNGDFGGGVRSLATKTTIEDCFITGNSVPNGVGSGGGVAVADAPGPAQSLTISDSTISDNSASNDGGGLSFSTGGTATISNSRISGNSAGFGAGISVGDSKVVIQNSTISGNTALSDGAGIWIDGKALTILDSTISGNLSRTDQAMESHGGGINSLSTAVTLNNVTIASNTASVGGGIDAQLIDAHSGRTFSSSNSIIADNTGASSSPDCAGNLDSTGYNLILDATGCTITGKVSTDLLGMDPELQALSLNPPGSTETQAPMPGSPVLKAGNPGSPNGKTGHCLPTDQRGVSRSKGACDIGAYQLSS